MTTASKRRWFQWSLRTLFAVVTVVGCWIAFELNWIRQRHAVLSRPDVESFVNGVDDFDSAIVAPLPLRLFGEPGCWMIFVMNVDDERGQRDLTLQQRSELLNPEERLEIERIKRLFPEAVVQGGVFTNAQAAKAGNGGIK